ncbi:hypothetical protein CR513_18137, partial [Mucuna pruriens]
MEQAIDELEQQSMQTRAEVDQIRKHMGEMREQLNKVLELLTRNTSLPAPATTPGAASNSATQGTLAYPPGFSPQYGMPLGWNAPTEAQVVEEPEAVEASRSVPQATQATESRGHPRVGRKDQFPGTMSAGGHDLDAIDLCLMSDVALPVDFKTPKFEKYKGSSCPRGQVRTWRDLAEAFVRQYKYNEDIALDRSRLQNLSKAESEGFKDYA